MKEKFAAILKEHGIESANDYNSRSDEEFEGLYEDIFDVGIDG